MKPVCDYCGRDALLVNGATVYPHRRDLKFLRFWMCGACDAYVGCHKEGAWVETKAGRITSDGTLPLGRLANAELRRAKQSAHAAIDSFWQDEKNKSKARRAVYARLAACLGIDVLDCHIGNFDIAECRRVYAIANEWARAELAKEQA